LRFQIEFNFRDAKQYWGLEDFMNVTPTGVTNAANLSLFMVNVAYHLRADSHPRAPDYSVLDLKADCRGYKYVEETIKMLPEKPVVLENSNVEKLASNLYLSVHSLPQEGHHDTDDASAGEVYSILVSESTVCTI
jgi:putative transposase